MNYKIYRSEAGFAELRVQWNDLLARSRFDTLFSTWEWQTTWWRCLGAGDLWLSAWHDGQALAGIAPLYLKADSDGRRRLSLVGCIEVSDYLDLIVAAGQEQAVYTGLLDWLTGPEAPAWDVLDLCNLPEQSLTHRLLPELAAERGLEAVTELEDVCPIIELPADWDAYLMESLSKKQRHEVRRKMRKIEHEAEVSQYRVNGASDLDAAMNSFIDLHRLSAPEKRSFMTPEMQSFFREITQIAHDSGWLRLDFLELNGERAAALLGFDYRGRFLLYNSGYHPDRYAELSPGIVLTSYVIQEAIARGCHTFDFLQGDEVYKYRFGAIDTAVYRTLISPSRATESA